MNAGACIACGYAVSHPYFHTEDHPLSVMHLPRSAEEALSLERRPMRFNLCARCGHIFNTAFSYEDVPYADNSNLMFNRGSGWQVYLDHLLEHLDHLLGLEGRTCVEIGCGDGEFLAKMQERYGARGIGFEPGLEHTSAAMRGVEAYRDYFVPERDIPRFAPDLIICRHVLEHLDRPLGFVTEIAHWSVQSGHRPWLLAEVPRIDKAVTQGRVNDYLYEHVSNFSDASFSRMFDEAMFDLEEQWSAYGDEVIVGLARPREAPELVHNARLAEASARAFPSQLASVSEALRALRAEGPVALWGGTGKSSAFINAFGLEAASFPLVVDSDVAKCGYHVPGTGQRILPPTYLREHPVDSIVITTQWRARDIYEEIQRREIPHRACYAVIDRALMEYAGESI